jgi:hypothetical protein
VSSWGAISLLIRLGEEEEKLPPMMTQEQAEELAKFAKNEIERDFPLYMHIRLWVFGLLWK